MFIDTHAHLDDESFAGENPGAIIKRANDAGVGHIIAPATDLHSAARIKEMAEDFPGIYFAAGFHPHEAKNFFEKDFVGIKKILEHEKAVAVGEVGLDYHYNFTAPSLQRHVLKRFLDLSVLLNLPLILHCREAEKDLYDLLSSYEGKLKGVVHCFTGEVEWAKKFLELGFYIGLTGIITFKNNRKIQDVASEIPQDRILTETDSPYMAPVPYRGKRNQPAYIPIIAEKIAQIKGKSLKEMAPIFLENAMKCFKLKL